MRSNRALTILFLVIVLSLGTVGTLQALPQNEIYEEFYSDSTFTTMVGWRLKACVGGISSDGQHTLYIQAEHMDCNTWTPITITCGGRFICTSYNPPGDYGGCSCG